eukprot:281940-Chlamydomonas_euryale.AAC.1
MGRKVYVCVWWWWGGGTRCIEAGSKSLGVPKVSTLPDTLPFLLPLRSIHELAWTCASFMNSKHHQGCIKFRCGLKDRERPQSKLKACTHAWNGASKPKAVYK